MRFDARRCTTLPHLAASVVALSLLLAAATRLPAQGPQTSTDTVYFMSACTHDEWVNPSQYKCRDSTNNIQTFQAAEVQSATLTITLKNGKRLSQRLPAGTDAVFFSNHALEKFLAPYYASVGDRAKAEQIRRYASRLALPPERGRKKAPPRPSEVKKP